MAIRTLVLGTLRDASGEARLEIDYDDTSDREDWSLEAVRCVNGLDRPVFVDFRRTNKSRWFSASVPAGELRQQAAGGPVRRESDLPDVLMRT